MTRWGSPFYRTEGSNGHPGRGNLILCRSAKQFERLVARPYLYGSDWNTVTKRQTEENTTVIGYKASKTFAEKAAWKFIEQEKPNFTLTTICPPLVLRPILHSSLSSANLDVGNRPVVNFLNRKARHQIHSNFLKHWVDVHLALCHVAGVESDKAANKRILVHGGTFSNKEIGSFVRQEIAKGHSLLPTDTTPGGEYPDEGGYKIDNSLA